MAKVFTTETKVRFVVYLSEKRLITFLIKNYNLFLQSFTLSESLQEYSIIVTEVIQNSMPSIESVPYALKISVKP